MCSQLAFLKKNRKESNYCFLSSTIMLFRVMLIIALSFEAEFQNNFVNSILTGTGLFLNYMYSVGFIVCIFQMRQVQRSCLHQQSVLPPLRRRRRPQMKVMVATHSPQKIDQCLRPLILASAVVSSIYRSCMSLWPTTTNLLHHTRTASSRHTTSLITSSGQTTPHVLVNILYQSIRSLISLFNHFRPHNQAVKTTCAQTVVNVTAHQVILLDIDKHTGPRQTKRRESALIAIKHTSPCRRIVCTCGPTTRDVNVNIVGRGSVDHGCYKATSVHTPARSRSHAQHAKNRSLTSQTCARTSKLTPRKNRLSAVDVERLSL